ncbi:MULTISPECIES: hypothetical protein [unclassified Meiothermus]|uniref:hypothetical protein n=1 Tax=unclassified Meiothermus TaxID=370471 RepID=UPI000D7C572F|nr:MULTISPECIES: hypothetical protein [unclassified Meiothermus]PZA06505.1 hypothetical protein DNA98_13035 [Meiothermus sp. Pnk-1]RYM37178.1 hypothetical protein EWH23_06795 [Meiothermus sp. PNK-Is4]
MGIHAKVLEFAKHLAVAFGKVWPDYLGAVGYDNLAEALRQDGYGEGEAFTIDNNPNGTTYLCDRVESGPLALEWRIWMNGDQPEFCAWVTEAGLSSDRLIRVCSFYLRYELSGGLTFDDAVRARHVKLIRRFIEAADAHVPVMEKLSFDWCEEVARRNEIAELRGAIVSAPLEELHRLVEQSEAMSRAMAQEAAAEFRALRRVVDDARNRWVEYLDSLLLPAEA